ncbi:tetratricopeptide repeat protein [Sorangium sp. So ce295]|uniref:SEL1-like repeat protein n=1 Tax=Sorangium sp. So ce295 TaxID=3133295 RepID=UPI003F61E2E3
MFSLASTFLAACGGAGGEIVRPNDITGTDALGTTVQPCGAEPKLAQALVVDLDASSRVDLEASMKKGVAIVAYDCKSLRVLPSCKLANGDYEYAGVSRKEQVVQMTNQDDLNVNLPLSAGKIGADMKSGNSIDLALVLVGRRATTVEHIDRAELTGSCDGATHFLQSASLGAFSMTTGSAGKIMAVADLFKIGSSGSSSASRNASSTDGSLEACRTADPDAPSPPPECRSPLSVQLHPLGGASAAKEPHGKEGKSGKEGKEPTPQESPCPRDFVFSGGICTRAGEAAHLCKPENGPDCREQCEKGSAESCYNYAAGKTVEKNEREAYYKKACDGGVANGCGWYGLYRWQGGDHSKSPANKEAIELARKGCSMGGSEACTMLGDFLWGYESAGPFSDLPGAVRAYERACALGDGEGCSASATQYLLGEGVGKDEVKAFALMNRACYGGYPSDCVRLGELLAKSRDHADTVRALSVAQFGCAQEADLCSLASKVALRIGKDADAFALAKSGCDRRAVWCEEVGDLHAEGKGVPKDLDKAKENWRRSCEAMRAEGLDGSDVCAKANGAPKQPSSSPKKKR